MYLGALVAPTATVITLGAPHTQDARWPHARLAAQSPHTPLAQRPLASDISPSRLELAPVILSLIP